MKMMYVGHKVLTEIKVFTKLMGERIFWIWINVDWLNILWSSDVLWARCWTWAV